MTEYHPPMTGLEAHFEEELTSEAHLPGAKFPDALQQQMRVEKESQQRAEKAALHETQADHIAEEAMHLDM